MKRSPREKSRDPPTSLTMGDVLKAIGRSRDPKALSGMSRFGIETSRALGVSLPRLRDLAKKTGRSHELAQQLWKTGIHEARLLAGMIDDPSKVTAGQMEKWAKEFDSWDIIDGSCGNLFDKTPFAVRKAHEWAIRPEEYVKRAGFVLMAELAVHDEKAADRTFLGFLPIIVRESSDERNFVRKAVNWALRQIGKRNIALNKAAITAGKTIEKLESRTAKWVAADALRELESSQVQARLKRSTKEARGTSQNR